MQFVAVFHARQKIIMSPIKKNRAHHGNKICDDLKIGSIEKNIYKHLMFGEHIEIFLFV